MRALQQTSLSLETIWREKKSKTARPDEKPHGLNKYTARIMQKHKLPIIFFFPDDKVFLCY